MDCKITQKIIYNTREIADLAIKAIGVGLRQSYWCKYCKKYHISSQINKIKKKVPPTVPFRKNQKDNLIR